MSLLIILFCIVLLVVLITHFKINAFLAFLIISILAGLLLGMPVNKVVAAVQTGLGDMLGSLVIVIVAGAMLGKLVADSGAAQRIATGMMGIFGERYIGWALMVTGFVIGIPLFYNVGFVLVIPLIFSVAYQFRLPVVFIGIPMLASLSVTHGFLPPHPSPTALVAQFGADMGTTLIYGALIAIPTVIIAGPIFAVTTKKIVAQPLKSFQSEPLPESELPGMANSVFSSLSPVLLLALTTLIKPEQLEYGVVRNILVFVSDPAIVMLLSLAVATYSLGLRRKKKMQEVMNIYVESVKDIAMLLLIVAGAGSLKEILIESGVGNEIGDALQHVNMHPLLLGWLIASVIRVCVGSATVAGLTAAGIFAPILTTLDVNANLMVLAIGAGSLMFSHVNDSGFWLFKEYFNVSIKDTIKSWSLMETVVSIVGIIGVLILDAFI
ncbi:MAG: TRAP transporter large permease subunit [Bacteroidia bacterium]|nr:TRAP transporter large permease subunit [Bacteroidia bacterium]